MRLISTSNVRCRRRIWELMDGDTCLGYAYHTDRDGWVFEINDIDHDDDKVNQIRKQLHMTGNVRYFIGGFADLREWVNSL